MTEPIAEGEAWELLDDLARIARSELGERLVCLTVFGSLVNGEYVPGFSDIDQVIVVEPNQGLGRAVEAANSAVRQINRRPGKFRDSLHEGYVVSREAIWSQDADSEEGLVLRDVVDLALHGRTVEGSHIWPTVRRPTDEELRESVVAGVFWIPEILPGLKSILNCIFAVGGARYYCSTGTMTWTKGDLARRYAGRPDLPFGDLVQEAAALRSRGTTPAGIAASTLERLQPQYSAFLRQTRSWMAATGLNRLRSIRSTTPGVVCEGGAPPQRFG